MDKRQKRLEIIEVSLFFLGVVSCIIGIFLKEKAYIDLNNSYPWGDDFGLLISAKRSFFYIGIVFIVAGIYVHLERYFNK